MNTTPSAPTIKDGAYSPPPTPPIDVEATMQRLRALGRRGTASAIAASPGEAAMDELIASGDLGESVTSDEARRRLAALRR